MKARHIKKLRKKILNFKEYKILETKGLFGNFFDDTFEKSIMADSFNTALKRYFRKYYRRNKEIHNYYDVDTETTSEWGKIRVKDYKGFKKYFR